MTPSPYEHRARLRGRLGVISGQVLVYDLDGRPPIRLTSEGEHYSPIWTPDGRNIVFEKNGSDR